MKIIYAIFGLFFLGLGFIGIWLPILPTVPFLLLASFFLAKSSTKVNQWFKSTQIYQTYLKDFEETKMMKMKTKLSILIFASVLLIAGAIFTPIFWVKLLIIGLMLIKWYVFMFVIKTASGNEGEEDVQ